MRSTPERSWRLLLASNNAHKAAELRRLLAGHRILLPRDLGIRYDPEETADTFRENAIAKALDLLDRARGRAGVDAVVADDSGLCVEALGGRPGVHSNRYGSGGGTLLGSEDKIRLLLEELEHVSDRRATFVCALALAVESDRFVVVQEVLRGEIGRVSVGTGGFGYDPVFVLPETGRTLAELADTEKDRVSHRGRAARRLRVLLDTQDPG